MSVNAGVGAALALVIVGVMAQGIAGSGVAKGDSSVVLAAGSLMFRVASPYVEIEEIAPVHVGEPLVINGTSNREDGTIITVTVIAGPAYKKIPSATTEVRGGRWSVTLDTSDAEPGIYTVRAEDEDGNVDEATFELLPAAAATPTPHGPVMSVHPESFETDVYQGSEAKFGIVIEETSGLAPLKDVHLSLWPIVETATIPTPIPLPEDWVSFDKNNFNVPAGGSVTVQCTINVPGDAEPGWYYGSISVCAGNDGCVGVEVTVNVLKDAIPPEIVVYSPKDGETVHEHYVTIKGVARDNIGIKSLRIGREEWIRPLTIGVGEVEVPFEQEMQLEEGWNYFTIEAEDLAGNIETLMIGVKHVPVATTPTPVLVLPCAFYGNVTIDGAPAPVGTEIVAKIDDEIRGSITVTEPGKYGNVFDTLIVVGSASDEGKRITFYVNGIEAEQTAVWQSGGVFKLDLSVRTQTTPSPTPPDSEIAPSPTPIPVPPGNEVISEVKPLKVVYYVDVDKQTRELVINLTLENIGESEIRDVYVQMETPRVLQRTLVLNAIEKPEGLYVGDLSPQESTTLTQRFRLTGEVEGDLEIPVTIKAAGSDLQTILVIVIVVSKTLLELLQYGVIPGFELATALAAGALALALRRKL